MVRLVAPQDLYGSGKQESKTGGYWVNKESGNALAMQDERRSIRYQYGKSHLRIGPTQSEAPNRVLVLGDSFTFGFALDWEDTYVARLQSSADKAFGAGKIQFLNAATTYWGTADYTAFYEDYGKDLDIKTVLVFLNTDDIGRSVQSGVFKIDGRTGELERPPHPPLAGRRLKYVMNSIPFYEYMIERSHLLAILRHAITYQLHTGPPPEALVSQWENGFAIPRSLPDAASAKHGIVIAKRLFERMSRLAGERHHRLIVLTTGWHKFGHPNADEPTAAFMAVAEEFFKERGIEFVDLSDDVYRRANGTLATLVRGSHPNETGAGVIAGAAWEVLSKKLP